MVAAVTLFVPSTTPALSKSLSPHPFYLFDMEFSENFDISEYINVDMFEDDVPEKEVDTLNEDSQAVSSIHMVVLLSALCAARQYEHDPESTKTYELDFRGADILPSFTQDAPQLPPPDLPFALFQDTTNAAYAYSQDHRTGLEDVPAPSAPVEATEPVANDAQAPNENEDDGTKYFQVRIYLVFHRTHCNLTPRCYTYNKQPPIVPNDNIRAPLPPTSNPPDSLLIAGSQASQQDSSSSRATTSRGSDKENAPLAHPPVDERPPVASQIMPSPVVARRRRRAPEEQPIAGPSSVTLDDLASAESRGSKAEQERPRIKRPRSTSDKVSSVQTAARKAAVCGLDGGQCTHALTDVPRNNKKHVKNAHPCKIPSNAGTPESTTGALYHKGKALSDERVREFVAKKALACTWGTPGGARCGSVFSGIAAEGSLARHVEETHWGREFACDQCTPRRTFGSLRALQIHMDKYRNKKHPRANDAGLPKDDEADEDDGEAEEEKEERSTKRQRLE